MPTKVARLDKRDVERICRLSGLPRRMRFADKVRVVLDRLEQGVEAEQLRGIIREELQRIRCGSAS